MSPVSALLFAGVNVNAEGNQAKGKYIYNWLFFPPHKSMGLRLILKFVLVEALC